MGIKLDYAEGATPLDADETEGLIPGHIATQEQLNRWEYRNVLSGEQWAFAGGRADYLSIDFMQILHRRMFGDTWRWAGKFRTTEKNIGIAPHGIAVGLKNLCDDVNAQLESKSLEIDEIAAKFHHRLVYIHPFPNGNGRFSRTMADLLLVRNSKDRFTWGADDLISDGEIRHVYIAALRAADAKDYTSLLQFVRSTKEVL